MLAVDPHPLLDLVAFQTVLPAELGTWPAPDLALSVLARQASPMPVDDSVKNAVRDLLRHGGFKPSGRSKPASEYVLRAVPEGRLGVINPVVDACNAASLHFGLPISVVDLDRTHGDLRVAIAPPGACYVFNASGQEIDLSGLLCLFDGVGPCANAVKDAQRTKTSDRTVHTLSIVWGTTALPGRAAALCTWYRGVLEAAGCATTPVVVA